MEIHKTKTIEEEFAFALNVIFAKEVTKSQEHEIARDVLQYWKDHVNPGFLQYRKSVTKEKKSVNTEEEQDFAAIEWRDSNEGGCEFKSLQGKEYIDLLGGFGIYSCGHRHPKVVAAVKAQLEKQPLHSQELLDPLRSYAARLLARVTPGDLQYTFFTNSGTESVEACLKVAMMHTKRHHFVATIGAFHGKTLGALSCTSKSNYRLPFQPALMNVHHLPLNDIHAARAYFEGCEFNGNKIAGFILETVQGEGGINICTNEYLQAARELCTKHGALLIFDEVQTGMGRTGKLWGCQHSGVVPDVMALGKGLGGGVMPVGACIATPKIWEEYIKDPFLLTTTFGGNPLALAAVISSLEVVISENLAEQSRVKGIYFLKGLHALTREFPDIIKEARGIGLMCGLEFHNNQYGWTFSSAVFKSGVLVSGTLNNAKVIRIEPPLTISYEKIDQSLRAMHKALKLMRRKDPEHPPMPVRAKL